MSTFFAHIAAADVGTAFTQGSGMDLSHTRGFFGLILVLLTIFIAVWASYGIHSKWTAEEIDTRKAVAGIVGVAALWVLVLVLVTPSI